MLIGKKFFGINQSIRHLNHPNLPLLSETNVGVQHGKWEFKFMICLWEIAVVRYYINFTMKMK